MPITVDDAVALVRNEAGMTEASVIHLMDGLVGGAFTSGDIYVMNNGTLNLNSGGSITTTAIRLGGPPGGVGFAQASGDF